VQAAIQALNYQPKAIARNFRLQQTRTIGVLLPGLHDYFFSSLAYVIEKALLAQNYRPLFCSTEHSRRKEADYLDMIVRHGVDGIIMVPTSVTAEVRQNIQEVMERDIPVVLVDNCIPELEVSQVGSMNREGAYSGAQHFLSLGHRAIAVVVNNVGKQQPQTGGGYERIVGIQEAFADSKLAFDPSLIVVDDLKYTDMGYQGALSVFKKLSHATAIFALTDEIAIGVLRAAADAGIRVPQDVSVMGYGDIPLAAHLVPRLTTIRHSTQELGDIATAMLIQQLQDGAVTVERRTLKAELIVRESTTIAPC
jgi:LacI family transcriptional regulator